MLTLEVNPGEIRTPVYTGAIYIYKYKHCYYAIVEAGQEI